MVMFESCPACTYRKPTAFSGELCHFVCKLLGKTLSHSVGNNFAFYFAFIVCFSARIVHMLPYAAPFLIKEMLADNVSA